MVRAELRNGDGWVLIHGLPGFGKTTLAAEALRDGSLLQDVFPGGVFWLSMDMSSRGELDERELLADLRNFIRRVDKDKYTPETIREATEHLKTVMSQQHPRSLLILDDVWDSKVAKAFDVCHRVLVTSRNDKVTSDFFIPAVCPVSGFTEGEAMEMLSKMTNKPQYSLPSEAKEIVQFSLGSPLILGMVGAQLAPRGRQVPARWKAVSQQIKTSSVHNAIARMNESIGVIINGFSKETKERFDSLVVFMNCSVIHGNVLDTFWRKDVGGAYQIMEGELLSV